jgi:hypothetical protein
MTERPTVGSILSPRLISLFIVLIIYGGFYLQVDVKHFLDRQGSNANSPQNHHRYRYQLWVPHVRF